MLHRLIGMEPSMFILNIDRWMERAPDYNVVQCNVSFENFLTPTKLATSGIPAFYDSMCSSHLQTKLIGLNAVEWDRPNEVLSKTVTPKS